MAFYYRINIYLHFCCRMMSDDDSCSVDESIELEYDEYPLDLIITDNAKLPLDLHDYSLDVANANHRGDDPSLHSFLHDWNATLDWDTWRLPESRLTTSQQPDKTVGVEEKPLLEHDTPEKIVLRKSPSDVAYTNRPKPRPRPRSTYTPATDKNSTRDACRASVLCEDIITDYGRRSWCDYEVNACPTASDVFVASEKRLSQLIAQTAQRTADEHARRASSNENPSEERPPPTRLERCRACCKKAARRFQAQHPMPAGSSKCRRFTNLFLCPPHGPVARYLTLALVVAACWTMAWTLYGHDAIHGYTASVFLLYVCGFLGARIAVLVRLPSYSGEWGKKVSG